MKPFIKKARVCLASIFLGLSLFCTDSSAVMQGMSTADLTRASDLVIEGDVTDVSAFWSRDGNSIISRATISQSYVIRGQTSRKRITVEYEGGEIGDTGFRVSDVAPLKVGERVILFLRSGASRINGNVFTIVGKGQGKYTVGSDGIARKGGFSVIQENEVIDNNIPVSDLIDKIRNTK
jgi:hypothetical protein